MQIPPKEFLKARKLARPITGSEFEVDGDEAQRLMAEGSMIRLLEGGKKLAGHPVSHFDEAILQLLQQNGALKWNKLFAELFKKTKTHLSELFVMHRLKALAAQGLVDMKGEEGSDWKERSFSIGGED
jgi:hypothetical protein